jgi:hypothetical protein
MEWVGMGVGAVDREWKKHVRVPEMQFLRAGFNIAQMHWLLLDLSNKKSHFVFRPLLAVNCGWLLLLWVYFQLNPLPRNSALMSKLFDSDKHQTRNHTLQV